MLRNTLLIGVLAIVGLLLGGCEIVGPTENTAAPPRNLTVQETQLVNSANRFGLKLFHTLNKEEQDSNIFISPLSVSMALGMTLNGARGETRAEMEQALEVAGLSSEQINQSYQSLIELLTGLDPKVTIELAQSIWYKQSFPVRPEFIEVNKKYFDARVEALDFSRPEAVDIINGWVEEKTHGKIEELIKRLRRRDVMALLNAIYFKGTWLYQFDEEDTRKGEFTLPDGSTIEVSFMHQEADLPYFANEEVQVVDLPYGDSLFSMTIVLPRKDKTVDELVAELDPATWNKWTSQFTTRGLALAMPKFKLRYKAKLKNALIAMGMETAFNKQRADFTGISDLGKKLFISRVLHKSFLEVNEEGTEAAAATAVMIGLTSVGGGGPMPLRIDRPFILAIREHHSGTILFIGKVVNPITD